MEIWQLIIDLDGAKHSVIMGSEEILRAEFEGWVRHKNEALERWDEKRKNTPESETCDIDEDPANYRVRVVHGFTDGASRASLEIAYRYVSVEGMALVRIS